MNRVCTVDPLLIRGMGNEYKVHQDPETLLSRIILCTKHLHVYDTHIHFINS